MGHYSESYERDEERARIEDDKRRMALAERLKKQIEDEGLSMVLAKIVRGEIQRY